MTAPTPASGSEFLGDADADGVPDIDDDDDHNDGLTDVEETDFGSDPIDDASVLEHMLFDAGTVTLVAGSPAAGEHCVNDRYMAHDGLLAVVEECVGNGGRQQLVSCL